MTDVLGKYKAMTYDLVQTEDPTQFILTVWNECAPGSYLKIELHDVEGVPVALVLERHNVGRRSMARFLDRLLDALDP